MGEKFCYVATVKLEVLGSKQFNDERKVKYLYPLFKSTWLPFSDLSGCVSECSLSGETLFLVMVHRLIRSRIANIQNTNFISIVKIFIYQKIYCSLFRVTLQR